MLNYKRERYAPLVRIAAPVLSRLGFRNYVERAARAYVSTDQVSGELQRELLERTGCTPASKVLEVGCGYLNAGLPIIGFLQPGNYAGIEPNRWLVRAATGRRDIGDLLRVKKPRFLYVDDFDATGLGMEFDFVLSHSVLSHCAHWQLAAFLGAAEKVLAPDGRVLASLRLSEGNPYGNEGTPDGEDSMAEKWRYPDVSFFKRSTVEKTALENGLIARSMPDYTAHYASRRPLEVHDWFIFSRRQVLKKP